MARVALVIPKVGLVMEAVRIARWLKNVGDVIQIGDPLLEVETEKSLVEIEATANGRLEEILALVDQEAKVGDQIGWVETGEAAVTPGAVLSAASTTATQTVPPKKPLGTTLPPPTTNAGERVRSSPFARRMAAEHGLDLRHVPGTGPGGRVQNADIQRSLGQSSADSTLDMSPMQRALARAMTLSNASVPQFTVEHAVDCTALQAIRSQYSATAGPDATKNSVNDFLILAVAQALIEMPAMNATFAGTADFAHARIVPAAGTHIGLVVAVDGGLLVPVFHNPEQLGLVKLAEHRQDVVERALKGRLKREELAGATFSISNLGSRGPDRFAAMINPPESAILAVGRLRESVVAVHGKVTVRPQMELTLTVDHRVANGRLAADFLIRVVEILEGSDWC